MSELTYKKIVDVETVEALNDAATVFINDNGAMKQVAADKFGVVKTVNGVAPDENGDVIVKTPRECLFVDASAMVPGLVQSFWSVEAIISTYREAKGTITFGLEVVDATTQKNGPTISHTASDMETITDDAGNTGYKIIIWFGDDHAPIIVNGLTNTITLDPDWVKPEENAGGSGGFLLMAKYDEENSNYKYYEEDVVGALNALNNLTPVILRSESDFNPQSRGDMVLSWILSTQSPDGYRYLNLWVCSSNSGELAKVQIAVNPSVVPDGM